jgi:prepilin-type N-terminal cleavage/methylation domain-containing protein
MMKSLSRQSAFTLIEVIIAVTVFTIFMGLSIGAYLSFHRAQQDAATTRALLLEMESVFNSVTQSIHENQIDYEAFASVSGAANDILAEVDRLTDITLIEVSESMEGGSLYLISPSGETQYVYDWDSEAETFTLQAFDESGLEADGYSDPIQLHSDSVKVSHVSFEIFPEEDPYATENRSDSSVQYQPIVRMNMSFTAQGRMDKTITLDLKTSVTSRFYQ